MLENLSLPFVMLQDNKLECFSTASFLSSVIFLGGLTVSSTLVGSSLTLNIELGQKSFFLVTNTLAHS
jgi:hypothetical protein